MGGIRTQQPCNTKLNMVARRRMATGPLKPTSVEAIPSYGVVHYTRLGSELNFDPSTCPPDSLYALRKGKLQNVSGETDRCPRLFIVGAKKGGTTSLYNYTDHHPDFKGIRLYNVPNHYGETFHFGNKWGKNTTDEYVSQFPNSKMSGDASVDNLVHCLAPQRIFNTCGSDRKVIILLRDPLDRYESNFRMRVAGKGYPNYSNATQINSTFKQDNSDLIDRVRRDTRSSLTGFNVKTI